MADELRRRRLCVCLALLERLLVRPWSAFLQRAWNAVEEELADYCLSGMPEWVLGAAVAETVSGMGLRRGRGYAFNPTTTRPFEAYWMARVLGGHHGWASSLLIKNEWTLLV